MSDPYPPDLPIASKPAISEKVLSNILSLGSGEIFARAIAFLGTAYLARVLGPEGFGIVGFALAIMGYLSLSITAGIASFGAREVARRPTNAFDLAASVILFRILLALVALAVLGLIVWFLPKPETVKLVVFLSGLSFFPLALDTAWVHKGLEQNRRVGVALVLTQSVYVVILLLFVAEIGDVAIVPIALAVGQMVAAIFLTGPLLYRHPFKANIREGYNLFKSSRFLIGTKLMRVMLYTFDVVLLGFLKGEREVGLYTAPYRVCYLIVALSAVILFSYLPTFTRAWKEGTDQVAMVFGRSIELSWVIIAPLIVGGIIVASPLLGILFGPSYKEGAAAFQLLLVSVGFITIRDTNHNVLLAYDLLKTEMCITIAGVAINIVLNVLLIPVYGLIGAAFATATAEGLILALGCWVVHRIGCSPDFRLLLRASLSVGIMTVALLFGSNLPPALRIGLGGITYIVALVLLKGIPRDALPYLKNLVACVRR